MAVEDVEHLNPGPLTWGVIRNSEGHRDFRVSHRVRTLRTDGPAIILAALGTLGLPGTGDQWNFGSGETDIWAICWPDAKISIYSELEGSPNREWRIDQLFSTKPISRSQFAAVTDPLLEPQKVSGSFSKYTREVTKDRNGDPIQSTSKETLHGPLITFDHNRPTVHIEQNVSSLDLPGVADMVDTVNDATLWGFGAREVKLSNVSWEKKWRVTNTTFFTRVLDFDIDTKTFDTDPINEGTKCLGGRDPVTRDWDETLGGGDIDNPSTWIAYQDRNLNLARVIIGDDGGPWDGTDPIPIVKSVGSDFLEYYPERNFALLGIPSDLEAVES